jgi:hypothetical protein
VEVGKLMLEVASWHSWNKGEHSGQIGRARRKGLKWNSQSITVKPINWVKLDTSEMEFRVVSPSVLIEVALGLLAVSVHLLKVPLTKFHH